MRLVRMIASALIIIIILTGCSSGAESINSTVSSQTTKQTTTSIATTVKQTTTTTTTTTTKAPTPTAKPTTTESVVPIKLIKLTTPIKAGDEATLEIQGLPETEFDISVRYGSTTSTAKGLENKTSGKDGKVSWTWKVGTNTSAGEHTIYVYGSKNQEAVFKFTVK